MKITIGTKVQKNQPGDYTDGRIGEVVEIDEVAGRARVSWTHQSPTHAIRRAIRTWVSFKRLLII